MRAIVIQKFGGPEDLVIKEIPDPEPKPGHVVIQVKAFGINHAEMHMRRGEWAEAAEVSGIVALMLERQPALGHDGVRKVLAATAHDLGPKGFDPQFGAGLVDAYEAIRSLGPAPATASASNPRTATGVRANPAANRQ